MVPMMKQNLVIKKMIMNLTNSLLKAKKIMMNPMNSLLKAKKVF